MDNVTSPVPKNQITSAFILNEFANRAAQDPSMYGPRINPYRPAISSTSVLFNGFSTALSGKDYTYTGDTAYMDKGVKIFPLIVLAVIAYLIWGK